MEGPKPVDLHTVTLSDRVGKTRSVTLAGTGLEIGRGTRASIERVLVDGKPMAQKKYIFPGDAARAMHGDEFLARNLPEDERKHLVSMELDEPNNAVIMPILNEDAFVVSMGKNVSRDREQLLSHPLPVIPNFDAFVKRLMDATQSFGDKGLSLGPDVFFLTIDRKTHELGYLYADKELVTDEYEGNLDEVPLKNIYWAAGMLNHALRECVQNPDDYLVRVLQEAIHRMNDYGMPNMHWQNELIKGREFTWPTFTRKQKLRWFAELVKRHVIKTWQS